MRVTVTTLTGAIVTLDVSGDMELENLKALCEAEVNVPSQEMVIIREGRPLQGDQQHISELGVKDGDVLLIQQMPSRTSNQLPNLGIDFSSIQLPGQTTPQQPSPATPVTPLSSRHADVAAQVWQELSNYPDRLSLLRQNNPTLADAFLSGNRVTFETVLAAQMTDKAERERKRIQMLNADPFDPEYQKLIAEEIRQDNVDSNMEAAMEYHPESFGQVTMLYVNCRVNGHPVRAFVDSGAQTTIMSGACAERCGILRLVDKRWEGLAKGVGTQKIVGRVHLGTIQIEGVFLQSSFSILEDQVMDMLLGLDMLKRHQCCIDLRRNVLVIGTTGTETRFLNEDELADLHHSQEKDAIDNSLKDISK